MFSRPPQGNEPATSRSVSGRACADEDGTPWPAPPASAPPARFSSGHALMRDGDETAPAAGTGRAIAKDEPARFADVLVQQDAQAVRDFVEAACADGVSLESIYLDLIVPAAVELGRAWEDDRYMFSDVTVGMVRLSQVLWHIGPRFRRELECARIGRSVLLVPARREQHALGVTMVADFFARAGWEVTTSSFRGDEAVRLARAESFDVIGLSAACTGHFDEMAADIQALRQASRNRAVGIMVGGAAFAGHGERVAHVGADATAGNALQAPLVAAQLVAARAGAS